MSATRPAGNNPRLWRAARSVSRAIIDGLESRMLLASAPPGLWIIRGDIDGPSADQIVIQPVQNRTDRLEAIVNGQRIATRVASSVTKVFVNAGRGPDSITVDLGTNLKNVRTTILGGGGADTIVGSGADDVICGGRGADQIYGDLGDDAIYGDDGGDLLVGEDGDDLLYGGGDDDVLTGGIGDDRMLGGDGDDQISGGFDDDILLGNDGEDTLRGGDGSDRMVGGDDNEPDTIIREKRDYWKYQKYDVRQLDQRSNPLVQAGSAEDLKQWIIESAVKQWQWAFGQPVWWWGWNWRGEMVYALADGGLSLAKDMSGAPSAESPGGNHSQTNTQEQNVDEADIVKTDGDYIYLLHNGQLLILDSWPADQSHIVSSTDIEGWPVGMYLAGSRLAVISDVWMDVPLPEPEPVVPAEGGTQPAGDAALTVMPPFWNGGWISKPQIKVAVYDVSDRASPTLLAESRLDGSLSSSRVLGGRMFMVVDNTVAVPRPAIVPSGEPLPPETPIMDDDNEGQWEDGDVVVAYGGRQLMPWQRRTGYVYESEESYRARLESMQLEDLLPAWQTVVHNADGTTSTLSGSLVDLTALFMPPDKPCLDMFSVVFMDLTAEQPAPGSSTTVMGVSGTVYASEQSLFVAAQTWDSPMGNWDGDFRTDIYRFALADDRAVYEGTGHVPGWTLNQFSMDEEAGLFRIATTSEAEGRSNNLFILQDTGDTLDIVGGITGLAFSERLYAARFMADRAYLVTFRQTDPLFVIDLSNPTDPVLTGVLEIPGYSAYLHPISADRLIGFGRDGDENGRIRGLQVSLFDVSDPANPQRIATYQFDTTAPSGWWWATGSSAEWDHHAFAWFANYQVLALPVLDWTWWNGSARMEILKVDPDRGFTKLGAISHSGEAKRALQIGDFIYSIGSDAVKVVSIDDPSQQVAEVTLPGEPPPDDVVILSDSGQ